MLRPHSSPVRRPRIARELFPADSCGCRVGARFLTIALLVSTIWNGWQYLTAALPFRTAALHVLVVSLAAAVVGKAWGILRFRIQSRPQVEPTATSNGNEAIPFAITKS